MGNMPNPWLGRAGALALATLLGLAGWIVGTAGAQRLAHGFTFDWYVHPTEAAYAAGHVLAWSAGGAAAAAFLAALLAGGLTDTLTRAWARRLRYAPPRYASPKALDVLLAQLALGLPALLALLTLTIVHLVLALPSYVADPATGAPGEAISQLSPDGFVLVMGNAVSAAALVAALVASLAVQSGVLSGRLARRADRNLIARISLFGSRHAAATVAVVIALTMLAGYHATAVNTNVDVTDVMPRGDPNTLAAKNLTSAFKSSFTQQVTFQFRVLDMSNATQRALYDAENERKLPNRVTDLRPENITDELYVRAIAEVVDFVVSRPPFAGSIASPDFVKLINWTIEGGTTPQNREGEASFTLPDTSREGSIRYAMVEAGVFNVSSTYAAVDAITSPNWTQTAVLVTVSPKADVTSKEIGEAALAARDAWVAKARTDPDVLQVFGPANPPQFSVDMPIANAHASALTAHDFRLLMPIIGAFIAITLFIAFRNLVAVTATFVALVVAVTWTFGVMGYLRIPLNTLNLAVVPLIMGIGIDYGIHMINEYLEFRAKGRTPEEAWTQAGHGSAFALLVGALTTIAGLLVMVVSPSLIVAQLGFLASIAIVSCYMLAILFVPAFVTLLGGGRVAQGRSRYTPSVVMPAIATAVSRARVLVVVVVLLLAGSAYASMQGLHREAFGDPPRNWLETDPLRKEHERAIQGFYETPTDDVKANVIIIEGDLTDPALHRYIDALTGTLRQNGLSGSWRDPSTNETRGSRVIPDTLRDLPFLLNTWLTVKDGAPGAGRYLGGNALADQLEQRGLGDPTGQSQTYPQTSEAFRETYASIFASPLAQFANLFMDHPAYGMTVIVFSVEAGTYADAVEVWDEVQAVIAANEPLRPESVKTSFFGNTAINYLFVAKQVPWLNAMAVATNLIVVGVVFAFTRRILPTLVVGTCAGLTSLFWFGLLPVLDIGLAISLTLPLIFIAAMGSDYALHLAIRCQRTRDTRDTMASVGKGVLFSFLTTFGAFLVFTRISDLAGRRSMVGTALAIAVVFLATLLVVPLFFPVKRRGAGSRQVPVVETRAGGEADHPAAASPAAPAPAERAIGETG